MAKRIGCVDNQTTKKAKIDDFNDLWGDDFDGDLIDDCFKRASQICEEDNNTTLLTPYSAFKQPNGIITSTQITQHPQNLEHKLREIQEKYAEKEGEVVILRANLQNLRTTCQVEQERKEKEWKDKLNSTQKESKSIKSELEFKNLEIANLKQQIMELSKHIKNDQNSTQKLRQNEWVSSSPQKPTQNAVNLGTKIQINSKTYYPLKRFNIISIFKPPSEEICQIKTNCSLYGTVHLQNQTQDQIDLIKLKKHPILVNEKELDLDYVYSEITFLINLSLEDINSEKSIPALNKIICVSLQLLTEFYDYLKQIEENIQLQDIQECDSYYLQENTNKKCENLQDCSCGCLNEMGSKSGKLLGFLAEILPFSSYFKNYLLQGRLLNLDNNLDYVKLLPCLRTKTKPESTYLTLILNIIAIMGRTRKEQRCSEFLSGVIKLLCKVFTCNENNPMNNSIYDIIKEVLFLRPRLKVIYCITFLLKSASGDPVFIDCLCSKPRDNKVKSATKGVLYFNRESCRFHMFVILLENTLPKINNEKLILSISLNILNFIYNVFKLNSSWLYESEDRRCNCLCQLYKLGIGIIYKNLKSYQEFAPEDVHMYKAIFKNGIKILHLLSSNSYDLIQKYVTDLARFKEIVYSLIQLNEEMGLDANELRSLEKLSIVEEFPEIPSIKFTEIDF